MNIGFHLRHIRDIIKNMGSFERAAKIADAYFNFPAPAIEQQLSSEKKVYRYMGAVGKTIVAALICVASIVLLWYTWQIYELPLSHPFTVVLIVLGCLAVGASSSGFTKAWSIYWAIYRRESQGSSHWATPSELRSRNMLFPRDEKVTPTHLPLAFLGTKYQIAIPIKESREHKAGFGPPGSGKSDSFSIWEARAYSEIGAAIILDMKGEIYRRSAHYYENVYRIDFERPEYSDRIDLLSFCRPDPRHPGEDAKAAGEISSFMIGYDPNNPKGGENPFWPQSATSMLKCFLMFLAEKFEHVQPADLFKVLAVLTKQAEAELKMNPKQPPQHPLHRAFMHAHNPEIRHEWSPLSTLDEKTLGNIVISMTTPIASFRDPSVQTIFTAPTNEERLRGCRVVDFRDLRRKGTAIYVVVPEGQASRFYAVLGTVFGVAMNVLRRTGEAKGACDTLIQLDEAGNVPLRNLREDIGVGRGRRMTFSLSYQSKNQPITQYGRDYAESFLQSCSVKVALPGITDETAEWFTKLLNKTTTIKRTINDARADALDSERLDEVGVDLMPANAFRTMERYKQCVIVINQASPVLARIPDAASMVDGRESIPQKFVWSEEELRAAKRDEIASRTFFEHVDKLPRLPRSPFDIEHAIEVAPVQTFDTAKSVWTTIDVMKEQRHREIKAYAETLKKEAPTLEEITEARNRVSNVVDVFAQAPEDVAVVGSDFAAKVVGDGSNGKKVAADAAESNDNNGGGNSNGNGSAAASPVSSGATAASTSNPKSQIEPTQNQQSPTPQPGAQQGAPEPNSAMFKRERMTPDRVREATQEDVLNLDEVKPPVEEVGVALPMAAQTEPPM